MKRIFRTPLVRFSLFLLLLVGILIVLRFIPACNDYPGSFSPALIHGEMYRCDCVGILYKYRTPGTFDDYEGDYCIGIMSNRHKVYSTER